MKHRHPNATPYDVHDVHEKVKVQGHAKGEFDIVCLRVYKQLGYMLPPLRILLPPQYYPVESYVSMTVL